MSHNISVLIHSMMACCTISAELNSRRCQIFKNLFRRFTLTPVSVIDYEPNCTIAVLINE